MSETHPCAISHWSYTYTIQLQQEQSSYALLFLVLGKKSTFPFLLPIDYFSYTFFKKSATIIQQLHKYHKIKSEYIFLSSNKPQTKLPNLNTRSRQNVTEILQVQTILSITFTVCTITFISLQVRQRSREWN